MFSSNDGSFLKGLGVLLFIFTLVAFSYSLAKSEEKNRASYPIETDAGSSIYSLIEIEPSIYLKISDNSLHQFMIKEDESVSLMSVGSSQSSIIFSEEKTPHVEIKKTYVKNYGKKEHLNYKYTFYIPKKFIEF